MAIFLWVLQGLLALAFLLAGGMKIIRSKEQLGAQMKWVDDFSASIIKGIGSLEVLGGLGLILPALTHVLPWITPVAASGLVLTMIGATITHLRRKETAQIGAPIVLLILCAIVAVGRFIILPIN